MLIESKKTYASEILRQHVQLQNWNACSLLKQNTMILNIYIMTKTVVNFCKYRFLPIIVITSERCNLKTSRDTWCSVCNITTFLYYISLEKHKNIRVCCLVKAWFIFCLNLYRVPFLYRGIYLPHHVLQLLSPVQFSNTYYITAMFSKFQVKFKYIKGTDCCIWCSDSRTSISSTSYISTRSVSGATSFAVVSIVIKTIRRTISRRTTTCFAACGIVIESVGGTIGNTVPTATFVATYSDISITVLARRARSCWTSAITFEASRWRTTLFATIRIHVIPVRCAIRAAERRTTSRTTLWISESPEWTNTKTGTRTITSVIIWRSTTDFTIIRIEVISVHYAQIVVCSWTAFGTTISILVLSEKWTIRWWIRWTAHFTTVRIIVRPIYTRTAITAITVHTTFGTAIGIVIEPRGATVFTCTAADLATVRIVEVSVLEALRLAVRIATLQTSGGVEVDSMCARHATTTHPPVLVDVVAMRTRGAARMIPKHSDNDQGDHPEAQSSQWDSVWGSRTTPCTAIVSLFGGLSTKHWKSLLT